MKDHQTGWHWVQANRTLRDGRPVVLGEWVEHDGPVVMCESGLHWSRTALAALTYAPGPILCQIEASSPVYEYKGDKCVSERRRVTWMIDASEILPAFARRVALDVSHLWDMPDVVREYLETGDVALLSERRPPLTAYAGLSCLDRILPSDSTDISSISAANSSAWHAENAVFSPIISTRRAVTASSIARACAAINTAGASATISTGFAASRAANKKYAEWLDEIVLSERAREKREP